MGKADDYVEACVTKRIEELSKNWKRHEWKHWFAWYPRRDGFDYWVFGRWVWRRKVEIPTGDFFWYIEPVVITDVRERLAAAGL